MVTTVTINPAVDKTYVVDKLVLEDVNRAKRIIYNAGSKGINVSRVLKQAGERSVVLGFVGGKNGEMLLSELATEGVEQRLVKVKGNTRLNVKIMDKSTGNVTEINEMGTPVSESEYEEFIRVYREEIKNTDAVVVSGSILPEIYKKVYYELIKYAKLENKTTFLDCGGPLLYDGILASPDYVKPNIYEFEDMLNKRNLTDEQIVEEARKIISRHGVKYFVVTKGADGAVAVSENESFKIIPPKLVPVSTVGAGDAFLAGLCNGYLKNFSFRKQTVLGTSYACAKTTIEGTMMPSMVDLNGYINGCRIIDITV